MYLGDVETVGRTTEGRMMRCQECDGSGEDREDIGDPCFLCDGSGAICCECGDPLPRSRDYPLAKCDACQADSPPPPPDKPTTGRGDVTAVTTDQAAS